MNRAAVVLLALSLTSACDPAPATPTADASVDAPSSTVWLCRPGQASNPCALSLDTSVVAADGAVTVERAPPAAAPPIDCFYVYPTVSAQGEVNADRSVDPELVDIAEAQAARFSSVCQVFAPVYRQVTVVGLISPSAAAGFELAYADVRDAWADYLARDNQGRGVVLIGHSQGAGLLTRLVRERIDGDPAARAKLVSALILGSAVRVPEGANVGGDFANVPACASTTQTGCVVAYSAFLGAAPADARFGRAPAAGSRALCVNPAAPGGAGPLRAVFHVRSMEAQGLVLRAPGGFTTPWVAWPGLYRTSCAQEGALSWLRVEDARAAPDGRPVLTAALGPAWGLHQLEVNLALGDLVELVRQQSSRWPR
jgi:hypothetical protein